MFNLCSYKFIIQGSFYLSTPRWTQTAVRFKKRTEIKVYSRIISHGWTDSTVEMWISDIRWINQGFICHRLLSWDQKLVSTLVSNDLFQIRLKNISVHQFCKNQSMILKSCTWGWFDNKIEKIFDAEKFWILEIFHFFKWPWNWKS